MAKKKRKAVPVQLKADETVIRINPNEIKVRDMRGILLSGCGYHVDRKKKQNKNWCREQGRDFPGSDYKQSDQAE